MRIRSVKPEFWQDERLARLPHVTRLLFIGLWGIADDEGRLRGNPLFIRAQVFPYEPHADVETALAELENAGLIVRYEADSEAFVWVRNFRKHQKIDTRLKSKLPAPPKSASEKKKPAPHADSRQLHADSAGDSTPVHADFSPIGAGSREQVTGNREQVADAPPLLAEPAESPSSLQVIWNLEAHEDLPRWQENPPDRKRAEKARLKERPSIPEWRLIVRRISASSFCRGHNERGWKASPDWLLKPGTAAKVLEGKYDDPAPRAVGPPPRRHAPCAINACEGENTSGLGLCGEHADEFRADPETQRTSREERMSLLHAWIQDRNARTAA
jgi:hypothetical protein